MLTPREKRELEQLTRFLHGVKKHGLPEGFVYQGKTYEDADVVAKLNELIESIEHIGRLRDTHREAVRKLDEHDAFLTGLGALLDGTAANDILGLVPPGQRPPAKRPRSTTELYLLQLKKRKKLKRPAAKAKA